MANRNVLISGAGVAGLALAHWLRRYGFTPTIVERAPGLRSGGQAIDIRGTGREAVDRMGLLPAIRAAHTGTHGLAYLDRHGRRQAVMAGDAFGDSGGIIAEIEILRGDLVAILHEAAGPDIEYLFDDVITGMTDRAPGVDVTFRRAAPRTFDLVIGADGLRSGVRRLAFGPDADLVSDLRHYTAYYAARTDLRLDGWELMYNLPAGNGVGGRVALIYPIRDTGEVRVMLAFAGPPLATEPDDGRDHLARIFAGAGWQLPALLAQLPEAPDVYFARAGAVRVDPWARGRTVLLGDSAFGGSIGMGTSLALVGAYVLAGELAVADGDHQRAFPAYQDAMRAYVAVNSKRPPGGTRGFMPNTARGIWLRNQGTRLMMKLPGKSRLTGGMQKATNSLALKDYRAAEVAHRPL